jgi:transcriptional regulator with XRE-family HTH domain
MDGAPMTRARSWAEVRAQKAPEISEAAREAARTELDAEIAGYRLKQIRLEQRRTQTELADEMQVSQRRVSAIESAALSTTEVGTIAAYVAALGGRLRLVADFNGETVVIHNEAAIEAKTPAPPATHRAERKAGDSQVSPITSPAKTRSKKAQANEAKESESATSKAASPVRRQPKKAVPAKRSHAASTR